MAFAEHLLLFFCIFKESWDSGDSCTKVPPPPPFPPRGTTERMEVDCPFFSCLSLGILGGSDRKDRTKGGRGGTSLKISGFSDPPASYSLLPHIKQCQHLCSNFRN